MNTIQKILRLWALSMLLVMAGCATGPKLVSHSFNYDGFNDKWADKVDLLAYSYGDQYQMVRNDVANPRSPVFAGLTKLPPGTGVNGPMPVGEFLRVKWRLLSTGEVFEERVDLRDRLPKDMTDHELTFVIEGRQLYVFVVTPRRKKSSDEPPVLKTWRSQYSYAYEIFPTLRKP